MLLFLLAMGCTPAYATPGPPAARIRHMLHNVWQTDSGLPQNSVVSVQQTPDGYIWVATEEGLARFDGVRFEVFTLANTPGSFRVEVASRYASDFGTGAPATIDVTVPSPIYQTWWFFGLCMAGAAAIGLGVSRWRFVHLQRREQALLATLEERQRSQTALQRSEQALHETGERFRVFYEQAVVGFYRTTPDGRILAANPALLRMLGYSSLEELAQRNLERDRFEPAAARQAFMQRMKRDGEVIGWEATWTRRDGRPLFVRENCRAIRDGSGQIEYFDGSVEDITERKRAEKEKAALEVRFQQAQKMESVGRLAGGVAHDFNNMLAVIMGHGELALARLEASHPVRGNLIQIEKAARHSANLTSQLLAFARQQVVAPEALDLNDRVSAMLKMLQRLIGEDITLVWTPAAQLWPVKIDPTQIDQVLANLCVNARDAITGVGTLTIETHNTTLDDDACRDSADATPGDYVVLRVSDTGTGMRKEVLDRIFEPFFTTKDVGRGTGLGLATVYGILRQNDGFATVSSEPGVGTTFGIHLPRHTAPAAEALSPAVVDTPQGRGETILLAEDEPAILELTTRLLQDEGYTVLAAGTPAEAVRLAMEHAGEIHLLLTDVVMPAMNGRDLVTRVVSIRPTVRSLFMSGYTADIIAQRGILEDDGRFIQKPFTKRDLAAKVRQALDREWV